MFHVQDRFEWVNVLWYQPTCSPGQRAVKRLCVSAHTVDVAGDIMFSGYLSICGYVCACTYICGYVCACIKGMHVLGWRHSLTDLQLTSGHN